MQRIDILETYSFHGEILVKLKKKDFLAWRKI
jgi:hypothetical protein